MQPKVEGLDTSFLVRGIRFHASVAPRTDSIGSSSGIRDRIAQKFEQERLTVINKDLLQNCCLDAISKTIAHYVSPQEIGGTMHHLGLKRIAKQVSDYSDSISFIQSDAGAAEFATEAIIQEIGSRPSSLSVEAIKGWRPFADKISSLSSDLNQMVKKWPRKKHRPPVFKMSQLTVQSLADCILTSVIADSGLAMTKPKIERAITGAFGCIGQKTIIRFETGVARSVPSEKHAISWPVPLEFDEKSLKRFAKQAAREVRSLLRAQIAR